MRRPSVLEEDETVKPYIQSSKVRLVKGDALSLEDVARGWTESIAASPDSRVDIVLFSIGESSETVPCQKQFLTVT